jgi:ATP-dependent Lon protease
MPAVIFFACLDFEQNSSFMDGHYLRSISDISRINHIKFFKKFKEQTPLFEKAKPVPYVPPSIES